MVRDHHLVKTAEIEDQINLPMSRLHLVRCAPRRAGGPAELPIRSSGPLVHDLRPRPKPVDQGIPGARHAKRPERCPGRRGRRGSGLEVPGSTRYASGGCGSGSGQVPHGRSWRARERDGGDEETRTPDPLLAKEMLFRLSYVPLPSGHVPEERVGWWAFLDSNQRPLPYQGSALTS